jgi:two-component system CheB/CheR fusion protein
LAVSRFADGGVMNAAAGGTRVLVVDDNIDAAASIEILLRSTGHDVRTAGEGQSALRIAEEFLPRVILLDIGLPDMDGYAVCRALREMPCCRDIFIAALTGWGEGDHAERAAGARFDRHLTKPVDFGQLLDLIPPA